MYDNTYIENMSMKDLYDLFLSDSLDCVHVTRTYSAADIKKMPFGDFVKLIYGPELVTIRFEDKKPKRSNSYKWLDYASSTEAEVIDYVGFTTSSLSKSDCLFDEKKSKEIYDFIIHAIDTANAGNACRFSGFNEDHPDVYMVRGTISDFRDSNVTPKSPSDLFDKTIEIQKFLIKDDKRWMDLINKHIGAKLLNFYIFEGLEYGKEKLGILYFAEKETE